MATWDDIRRIVAALPATEERGSHGGLGWRVANKNLVWERPLRKDDIEALGDAAPDGEIFGARVPDEGVKFALIADDPAVFFTTPHFDGYPAVLGRLAAIDSESLRELIIEAWLDRAPKKLVKAYLAENP